MERLSRHNAFMVFTMLGATLTPAHQATAQEQRRSQAAGSTLQEVVVTAQKREESLQNVPVSIAVLSGKSLEAPSYTDSSDALAGVAGVATNYALFNGASLITIRGASTNSSELSGSSTVAYYLDSVPYGLITTAIAPSQDVYDLK